MAAALIGGLCASAHADWSGDGASDLMVAVLGDRGRHARSTVGVAELPLDAAVEVEAMFEVR